MNFKSTVSFAFALTLAGCAHPGLPPLQVAHDPSRAALAEPEFTPAPNPFETSAFEGVKLGGGHMHHGHGGHKMPAPAKEGAAHE